MIERYCLIIDDNDQIANFKIHVADILRKEAYDVKLKYINPRHKDLSDVDGKPDLAKIDAKILSDMEGVHISVFASDFNLGDNTINGLDTINLFKKHSQSPIILYSANLNAALKLVIKDFDVENGNETIISRLEATARVNKYISSRSYYPEILKFLRDPETSLNDVFLQKLKENATLNFKSCYPKFSNKTLGEIAHHIETKTYHGKCFQSELIEQTIAYLIDINKDDI
jgi:hypothetical protein